jgi:biopolymer transport protein TolR
MAMSSGGAGVASTPNVTPMIDVMLVLLIIFMVMTPAMLEGFAAEAPRAVNLKDHPEDEELDQVLGIDKSGNFYINKQPIRAEDVGPKLNEIYSNRQDFILYLKADRGLEYSKIIDAMDLASRNRVKMIAFISEQTPNTISTVPGDSREQEYRSAQAAAKGGNP